MSGWLHLTRFHARQLLRTSFFLQQALLAPLAFYLLRALGERGTGRHLSGDLWVDAAIAGLWATTTLAVGIIGFQRFQGTLEHLAMSTLAPGTVFSALAAAATLIGLIGVPGCVLAQVLLARRLDISISDALGLVAAVIACCASASLLASLFVLLRSAVVYEPLILAPVWLLTGVVIPVASLPSWLRPIAWVHPLTAAVLATRASKLAEALGYVGWSLVIAGLWLAAAHVAMRGALARVRVTGTLALS